MFLLAITFHFSSSIQLVQHMLILVVPYVLLGRNWAKRGLSVPSPKKITLACVACLCFFFCDFQNIFRDFTSIFGLRTIFLFEKNLFVDPIFLLGSVIVF